MKKALVLTILSILFFSAFALAVSSGEGATVRERTTNAETNQIQARNFQAESALCENPSSRRERIHCRLSLGENYTVPKDNVPEACRNLRNPVACIALYKNVRPCYELEGRAKDRCFKSVSQFRGANLSQENNESRPQRARQYLVILLYDLEERIEDKQQNGEITLEESSELIDLIVEIKQKILDDARRSEILPLLTDLKVKYREIMS